MNYGIIADGLSRKLKKKMKQLTSKRRRKDSKSKVNVREDNG